MNETLKAEIKRIAKRSGTKWERYEDCKRALREAERKKTIAGSDWQEYIEFISEVLGL